MINNRENIKKINEAIQELILCSKRIKTAEALLLSVSGLLHSACLIESESDEEGLISPEES